MEDGDGPKRRRPLNDANFDPGVNFPRCRETRPGKRGQCFARVTDIGIDEANAEALARAGRARWRIGNGTFNTPGNQGRGFGHNHGDDHLAAVFANPVTPAFFITRRGGEAAGCSRRPKPRRSGPPVFGKAGSLLPAPALRDWETLRGAIASGVRPREPELLDTSWRPAAAGCAKSRFSGGCGRWPKSASGQAPEGFQRRNDSCRPDETPGPAAANRWMSCRESLI